MVYRTPAITFKFPESFTLFVFQCFLILIKFMVQKALNFIGICKHNHLPPLDNQEDAATSSAAALGTVPIGSVVPAVTILMEAIKKSVPVVKYGESVMNRIGMSSDEILVDCSICLSSVERCHEIRELSNCSHVFHRDCLDSWVDVGQVTCPLCRSMLLPNPINGDRSMLC